MLPRVDVAERTETLERKAEDLGFDGPRWNDYEHCRSLPDLGIRFIDTEIEEMEDIQHELHMLPRLHAWTDCLRAPHKAHGRGLSDGMMNDSPVYSAADAPDLPRAYEALASAPEVNGLYVHFGWQQGRMARQLTFASSWLWLSIAAIWLGTFLWADEHKGGWSTAMGFGQLLAACITLVMRYARD